MHYFNSKTKTKTKSKTKTKTKSKTKTKPKTKSQTKTKTKYTKSKPQIGGNITVKPDSSHVMENVFVTGDISAEIFRLSEDLMPFFNTAHESQQVIETGGGFNLKIVYFGETKLDISPHGTANGTGSARIWIQKNNASNKVRYVIELDVRNKTFLINHIPPALTHILSDPLLLLRKLSLLGVNVLKPIELENLSTNRDKLEQTINVAKQQLDVAKQQLEVANQRHAEANITLKQFINKIKADYGERLKWTFSPETIDAGHAGQALPSQALPRGWTQQTDPTGRPYYIDLTTKKSQWNMPVLPAGWTELIDADSGRRYYSNGLKPQWDPPT